MSVDAVRLRSRTRRSSRQSYQEWSILLPAAIVGDVGWRHGDPIHFERQADGSVIMRKVDNDDVAKKGRKK